MIATLLAFGASSSLPRLAALLAWGSVVGSFVQFAVQVPVVLRVAPDLRFTLDLASEHVAVVARNFTPVLLSRGVVQVSAYIDALLASLLPTGAVTGLANAQLLYTLAGEPLRHVDRRRRAAVDGGRGRRRRDQSGPAARAPGHRAPPHRVLRRAVRDRVPRPRRRARRGAAPDGTLPPCRRGLRMGYPRRRVGRSLGLDARTPLLLHLLRASRYPDAAPLRHRARGA